jgi:adenine/guanine phosphoribosyltransferase-like PRPP-binding protein
MKAMEIDKDVIQAGGSVIVVDDALAWGRTPCSVLQLLGQVGIVAENITVMVVAEFPVHQGREYLRQQGFGGVRIQSLLVFDGA